jgi:ferredoxin-NADP reductase
MKAKIKDKKEVAKGTLQVTFDLLGNQIDFKAGQFFFITIPKLNYPDDHGDRRHFSIVNSPNQKGIITMTTRIREESGFKKTLRDLPIDSEVEIGEIMGNFVLPDDYDKSLVFIAGGIGITPFMSMFHFIDEEKLLYDITLIYSNRDQESTAFLDELEEIKNRNKNIKLVFTMTEDSSWKGENRKIDGQFIIDHISDFKNKIFYISGPPAFNEAIAKTLSELKIEDKNILAENFSGY